MNKIDVIVSYHDKSLIDFNTLYKGLVKISPNIKLLDTNINTTDALKDFRNQYNYAGVTFDEFNTQAYFVEKYNPKLEYVYHVHYRRFLLDINKDNVILDKKTIYTSYENISSIDLISLNGYHKIIIEKLTPKLSEMLNLPLEDVISIIEKNPTPVREMYLCHKDVQKMIVEYTYEFIKILCMELNDETFLGENRFVGHMVEWFMGILFKKLEMFDGYNLIYKITGVI